MSSIYAIFSISTRRIVLVLFSSSLSSITISFFSFFISSAFVPLSYSPFNLTKLSSILFTYSFSMYFMNSRNIFDIRITISFLDVFVSIEKPNSPLLSFWFPLRYPIVVYIVSFLVGVLNENILVRSFCNVDLEGILVKEKDDVIVEYFFFFLSDDVRK